MSVQFSPTRTCSLRDHSEHALPNTIPPNLVALISAAQICNENGEYLPYYQLIDLAEHFQTALEFYPHATPQYAALETLIAYSIAEALYHLPILSIRFWRVISNHPNVCIAARRLLQDDFAGLHHRLDEEMTLVGIVRDAHTNFANLFPHLWRGPQYSINGEIADQIDPEVRQSLLIKIGFGDISTETMGLSPATLRRVSETLSPPRASLNQATGLDSRINSHA